MKTTVIYRGEAVEVPSFHAERLVRNGVAKLPKVKAPSSTPGAPGAEPPATAAETAADDGTAQEPKAGRRYNRRDMKAQD
ncbi:MULTISPECIES: hypothetical protein [Stenotrophomonas]|uniref:hypothetical protein n=1 Tax=Stenotrophomonas TaxID=40323 RepID=UPI000DB27744|nr:MULTISPECIES: hypothetical protein [Stenotrophomonas]MBA0428394.1 hypothetical protein [Stenotrophomonas maltophilia]MDH0276008.1 hypothetical protein [Stenotrophomonas sp. GD04089]MDH1911034.1 hypothetical protein [Stenotrophomonas sp. GD03794]PZP85507.1 MAG: hypothetical protein DI592_05545 [Stenotrophomonas maltophilia]